MGRGHAGALPDVGKEKRGDAFTAASHRLGDPLSHPWSLHAPGRDGAARPGQASRPTHPQAKASPHAGVGGWVGGGPGADGFPPQRSPLSPPSTPRIVPGPADGRRSRAKGQRAVGARAAAAGGKAGRKAGAGSVPPARSRLSCWSSCSSRLPVCPCCSRAARAGCTLGGRSRPALPWRGSRVPPLLFLLSPPATPGDGGASCRAPAIRPLGDTGHASHPNRRGWHPMPPFPLPRGGAPGERDPRRGPAPRTHIPLPISCRGTFLPRYRVLGVWVSRGTVLSLCLPPWIGVTLRPASPRARLPLDPCSPPGDGAMGTA